MRINLPQNPISFTYKSVLKRLCKEGKLPSVIVDIYNQKINPDTVTIEHIIPKSKGGKSRLFNYALADSVLNQRRRSEDILKYTTVDNIANWYRQFKGVKLDNFDGEEYISSSLKNLKKIGIDIKV